MDSSHERELLAAGCSQVESIGAGAAACLVAASNEAVRKITRSRLEFPQGRMHRVTILDHEFCGSQQLTHHDQDRSLLKAVRAGQHPRQFHQNQNAQIAGCVCGALPLDKARCRIGLFAVVLNDVAHQDISVKADGEAAAVRGVDR